MSETIKIARDQIRSQIESISNKLYITEGEYNFLPTCNVDDLDWNHMDWDHRPYIHNTYLKSLRVFAVAQSGVSITQLSLFGIKFWVHVSDTKIGRGLFYQNYTLFGLFWVFGVLENSETNTKYSWYIASSKWLKLFHPYISRKIYNLNHVQIAEDQALRKQRQHLRSCGFSFGEDERNFVTSNDKKMRTQYPRNGLKLEIDLKNLENETFVTKSLQFFELYIKKVAVDQILVWPGVCPHKGRPLNISKCEKNKITCPWHGYKIPGKTIGSAPVDVFGCRMHVSNNILYVE